MSKVKWGVLGCAGFARRRAIPAMLLTPSVELIAVASRTREKAESFRSEFNIPRAYASYKEMLCDSEIQAVYIPLPNGLHAEWMIKAAEHGKHILCEKSFTANAEEAQRVALTVEKHGVLAMEAFMWRLHAQHLRVRKIINDGLIGPVRLLRGSFSVRMSPAPNVRLCPELGGGALLDVGCYLISAARFYFAAEPTRVFAWASLDPKYGVDMRTCGVLEFPAGRALFDCAFDLPPHARLEILGDTGIVEISRPWQPDPEATIVVNGNSETLPPHQHYVSQFQHFSRCIMGKESLLYGTGDAICQMKVIDAVFRSIKSGQPESV